MTRLPRPTDIGSHDGHMIDLMDPRPEDFKIDRLAEALSKMCHWGGRCEGFFSVASHSVMVSQHLMARFEMAGLLHDAAEVYLNDIASPFKAQLTEYKAYERRFEDAIGKAFGLELGWAESTEVKLVDIMVLYKEASVMMRGCAWKEWPQFSRLTKIQRDEALSWKLYFYSNNGLHDFDADKRLFLSTFNVISSRRKVGI